MGSSHSRFVWYELMTTDTRSAEAFYRDVVGWGAQDAGVPDMRYTLFTAGEAAVGGMMSLPDDACEAGACPGWLGYVAVGDVDADAARVADAGGAVHRGPEDIPGIGRYAVVADPQGTVLALFKGAGEDMPPATLCDPGHAGWHELLAADGEAAFSFYAGLFGWTKAEPFDMGPMGIYQLFATGGETIGGMMTKPATVPAPFWLYYFNVDRIDPAAERVQAAGGQVLNGPMAVPGGRWMVQCSDPQGAKFALLGPGR